MPKKTVEKKIFTLDELKPAKHYKLKVRSFDKDKKVVGESPWIILKTGGKSVAPPNVTNLTANFEGTTLVIRWNGSAARAEKDFKEFRIKISSPNQTEEGNFFDKDNKFNFNRDLNRTLFGQFEGSINITVYSRDTSDNESSGVSISASSQVPVDPTNVKLTAATLGYNVSWDFPTFSNYYETRIYQSSTQNGTYALVGTAYGSGTFISYSTFSEVWVKVSHVNIARIESNLVASTPPSVIPIDPVPTDVTPPSDPTNLNWEDPEVGALNTLNGITTASKRAHWQVSEPTSGYKVRVSENGQNWAVYDVPSIKATITHKSASGTTATITTVANSFAVNDYITVFGLGTPFDGKFKVSTRTDTSVSYTLPSSNNISQVADDGEAIVSSYIVKELTPGTQHYGSILAYDSANNLTQFVSQGTFNTSGTAGQLGSPITISGTTMAFGPSAGGAGNNGLYINSNNYWYTTGTFKLGTSGNSVSWDGVKLNVDGNITARSGIFSGNVFIANGDASLIASDSITVQSGSWSSGIATITLADPVPGSWQSTNVIVIAQTGSSFDGQYVIQGTPSGNNVSFSMPSAPATYPVFNAGAVSNVSVGERVVFNSSGIKGITGNTAKFTLTQGGSLTIIDIVAEGINLKGGSILIPYTRYSGGVQVTPSDVDRRYSIFSDDGKDIFLKSSSILSDPAKIRWIDSSNRQRGTIGWDIDDEEGGEGTNYPNTLVIRANAVDSGSTDTPGQILIHAQGANSNINLKTGSNGVVTINGEPIETPGTISNRYKNGINSPTTGNKITFSSSGPSGSNPTPNRGDIHLRYL
jgi:hypothetical protein